MMVKASENDVSLRCPECDAQVGRVLFMRAGDGRHRRRPTRCPECGADLPQVLPGVMRTSSGKEVRVQVL